MFASNQLIGVFQNPYEHFCVIAIFLSVIATIGLRQQTDLHVPQLLGYRQAINHDGPKQKAYKRPAYLLVLPISICPLVLEHLSLTGGVSQQIPIPHAHLHTKSLVQSKCCIAIHPILYFKLATYFFRTEGPATCIAQAKAAQRAAGLGNSPPENPQGLKARPFAGMIVDSVRTARVDSPSTVDRPYFQWISNPAVTRDQPPV